MEFIAYNTDGTYSRAFVRGSVAEWKTDVIRIVLDAREPQYRFTIVDNTPAGGGLIVWDTDTVLGIEGADRAEAEAEGAARLARKTPAQIGAEFSAALEGAMSTRSAITEADAAVFARFSRQAFEHAAKCRLGTDEHERTLTAAESFAMLAEANGWPLDGHGVPLRESHDEANTLGYRA